MAKSHIRYLGQNNDGKWIAVQVPVAGGESGESRRYEFRAEKIDGFLELSDNISAILLDNEKQIPVALPLAELRRRIRGNAPANGCIDLCDATAPSAFEQQDDVSLQKDLTAAFAATLPEDRTKIRENPDPKITVFAHYRLDKNPTAKYCQLTTSWSNIDRVSKSASSKNTTYICLKRPVKVPGLANRAEWWFDMDAHTFLETVNTAVIENREHIDLREQTRKRIPKPEGPKNTIR
ncbi:MAG: hypothetical protein EA357_07560 [Micavibrio sp.]|nr:MAG: hypothetical protein EA357_07560 [Micavibrio sp.]